ncbi:SDR family NAD(P)-dependent oxidoreductase [Natrinema longum]|uniref:SDR family NAD(P)-dependent oxidoreductase n=1 Tax=Natrinema longum TaxID=370324 RepID=A0A8A2U7U8_9EURY|nr:SDR family NAD(P)-dependent oxidoreductase [Natrinema longum]MBZ6493979.1 SDR family NAD(P)-dependent oxidoreductase [Natrinema longum]QSW84686.1 SDR family NAD(P)-dependent oxidoreductase [Natrinema longum]
MTDGAIIVGASSGIGEALARRLAAEGYEIGLAARRTERLQSIGAELPTKSYVATMDVTDVDDARDGFFELAEAMTAVDLVVISAGIATVNRDLEWEPERRTIDVNVRGFTAIATAAMEYFEDTPEHASDGHLVGISSVAAHIGNGDAPAYSASKAYVSTYLEGLRYRGDDRDADVTITTIEPGFVDTKLSLGGFWECSPETAAEQIARAIRKERDHAYVTRRWRAIAWLVNLAPEWLLRRLF